jgi:hypothetical protein
LQIYQKLLKGISFFIVLVAAIFITLSGRYCDSEVFENDNSYTCILTINTIGKGTVTVDPPGPYTNKDTVRLTAIANDNWAFDRWEDSLDSSDNPVTITLIDTNTTVTAVFTYAGEPWRFVAVNDSRGSDNGINASILSEIAAAIIEEEAKLVLFAGDLVDGKPFYDTHLAQLNNWVSTFMEPLIDAGIQVYPARGGHENKDYSLSIQAWNDVFTGKYDLPNNGPEGEEKLTYYVEYENALFVCIDVYIENNQSRVNQSWLDTVLTNKNVPHLFVTAHEPAYALSGGHSDCLDDYIAERDVFINSIINAGGKTYFCGHDHVYDHAKINIDEEWFHQFIVGTGGAPLHWVDIGGGYIESNVERVKHIRNYGYLVVEIDGLTVTMTFKSRTAENTFVEKDVFSYEIGQ